MVVAETVKGKIHFEGRFDRPVSEDLWFKSSRSRKRPHLTSSGHSLLICNSAGYGCTNLSCWYLIFNLQVIAISALRNLIEQGVRTANKLSRFTKEALALTVGFVWILTEWSNAAPKRDEWVQGRLTKCSFVMKVSLLAVRGKNVYWYASKCAHVYVCEFGFVC